MLACLEVQDEEEACATIEVRAKGTVTAAEATATAISGTGGVCE